MPTTLTSSGFFCQDYLGSYQKLCSDGAKDPRHFVEEVSRRERRAWLYVSLTLMMIVAAAVAFIWWTW
jgi:hypothetical protein